MLILRWVDAGEAELVAFLLFRKSPKSGKLDLIAHFHPSVKRPRVGLVLASMLPCCFARPSDLALSLIHLICPADYNVLAYEVSEFHGHFDNHILLDY